MDRGSWTYVIAFFLLPALLFLLAILAFDASLGLIILAASWFGLGVVLAPAAVQG